MNDLPVGNGTAVVHLRHADLMCITNYQFYIYPSPLWFLPNTNLPSIIKIISVLLKHGNLALIIFGAVSNTAAFVFSISLMKKYNTAILFLILSIVDQLSVLCNLLPMYSNLMKLKVHDDKAHIMKDWYTSLTEASPELQSSFNCKFLPFVQSSFRSLSAWLIVLMTYFRLVAIRNPLQYRAMKTQYFLHRALVTVGLIFTLHSLPLITKHLISFDLGSVRVKWCHHRDILGIAFYHFEHIMTSIAFPILPCFLIMILNVLLLCEYQKATNTSITSSYTDKQATGELATYRLAFSRLALPLLIDRLLCNTIAPVNCRVRPSPQITLRKASVSKNATAT